jgi:hypothetical protein
LWLIGPWLIFSFENGQHFKHLIKNVDEYGQELVKKLKLAKA